MTKTSQEEFWASGFGKNYTNRNRCNPAELDDLYEKTWGTSRSKMNDQFLKDLPIESILEVGCNSADQLGLLQSQGHKNLYGVEIQPYALEEARKVTKGLSLVRGSALDLPFKDSFFDMVFTSGVLIHIHPDDLPKVMSEIYRTSKKYIWGYEFFNPEIVVINYRGNSDKHWKGDYAKKYMELFPDLKLVKEEKYKYLGNDNIDNMFLLEKA